MLHIHQFPALDHNSNYGFLLHDDVSGETACIGGVFDTLSKENPTAIGLDGWREAAGHFRAHAPDLPVGAIAGIDAGNARDVMAAGADGVAVISAIFAADDIERATRELREALS